MGKGREKGGRGHQKGRGVFLGYSKREIIQNTQNKRNGWGQIHFKKMKKGEGEGEGGGKGWVILWVLKKMEKGVGGRGNQ